MLFQRKKNRAHDQPKPYMTISEFADIFTCHIGSLYRLSFLLMGDSTKAERCLLNAFEICLTGTAIPDQWSIAWSKLSVVKSAIQLTSPSPTATRTCIIVSHNAEPPVDLPDPLQDVRQLPAFDRFVYVMSILARYRIHECSLLLNCSRRDVAAARKRALLRVAAACEIRRQSKFNRRAEGKGRFDRSMQT